MTTIKCPHCAGKGRVEPDKALPESLSEMISSIPLVITVTAERMANALGLSVNASRNRLRTLTRIGLVRRQKVGGIYRYSRVIRERKQE